jgi:hypothetical protein
MATDQEIALTRSVVGSDDDAEQTRSARLPGWSTGKAALGVGVAVLLLGTLASFVQGGVAGGADAMDSMIQSRAVAEHGRALTEDELVEVRGLVEKAPSHLRKLIETATATAPSSVSAECQTAVAKQATESMQKLIALTLESVMMCTAWKKTSSPSGVLEEVAEARAHTDCAVAQGKIRSFNEHQKTECTANDKHCEVITHIAESSSPDTVCVPTECHAFEELLQNASTALLKSRYPQCSQCSVEVTCGGE